MNQFKELNVSIAGLKALLASDDVKPEQRKAVEAAIEALKQLRRRPHARTHELYRCVRQVTENLIRAFVRR